MPRSRVGAGPIPGESTWAGALARASAAKGPTGRIRLPSRAPPWHAAGAPSSSLASAEPPPFRRSWALPCSGGSCGGTPPDHAAAEPQDRGSPPPLLGTHAGCGARSSAGGTPQPCQGHEAFATALLASCEALGPPLPCASWRPGLQSRTPVHSLGLLWTLQLAWRSYSPSSPSKRKAWMGPVTLVLHAASLGV